MEIPNNDLYHFLMSLQDRAWLSVDHKTAWIAIERGGIVTVTHSFENKSHAEIWETIRAIRDC
jgi:hypothetical protein